MGDPSPESKAALTEGENAKRRFKEFLNRYRQKYYTSLNQAVLDPRTVRIFEELREVALDKYKVQSGNNLLDVETDALVLAVVPHAPPAQSSNDEETGLSVDAHAENLVRLDLKCYILADPRSHVASPSIDILLQALQVQEATSVESGILKLLPTFTYDISTMQGVMPVVGDIVKVKSDSSALLTGVCTAVTKANIAYLLAQVTNSISADNKAKEAMDAKRADSIGTVEAGCVEAPGTPRYNPAGMSISHRGKKFILRLEGYREWVYDDSPDTNGNAASWMGTCGIGGSAHARWRWADYYIPNPPARQQNWYTAQKPGWPWGTKSVPTIGAGHAIKVQDSNSSISSLTGDSVNEREMYDSNFKQDMQGMPDILARQQAGGYWKDAARIGYNPNKDPAPLSEALATELLAIDIESHCAYFKKEINVPITQNQFDAMASICFDKGPEFYGLKMIVGQLNKGNCHEAAKWFMKSDQDVATGESAATVARRTQEAQLFAGYGYTGNQGVAIFAEALEEHRNAAAALFVKSKGKYKKWVGKSGWFDEQIQRQGADAVIQVSTVGQNTPVGNRTPCSYLYPETTPGSETVVYGAPPECDEQS